METDPAAQDNINSSEESDFKSINEHYSDQENFSSVISENELVTEELVEAEHEINEHSFGQLPGHFCEVVIKAEIEDVQGEVAVEDTTALVKIDCKICQKLFATKDGLKQHLRFVRKNEKK
jgi:hypothetical protein